MVASTDDCGGSSAITSLPSVTGKRPRTLVTMRWRALNETWEWLWSSA